MDKLKMWPRMGDNLAPSIGVPAPALLWPLPAEGNLSSSLASAHFSIRHSRQARQGASKQAAAMAAATASLVAAPVAVPVALEKSAFAGASVVGLPALRPVKAARSLSVVASGVKKINTKTPLGPSGNTKFKDGKDAGGGFTKGKGVYQFAKKYGANVDGYSPIWVPDEWSANGNVYSGGTPGLLLWALTLAGLLAVGGFLVYSTSALA